MIAFFIINHITSSIFNLISAFCHLRHGRPFRPLPRTLANPSPVPSLHYSPSSLPLSFGSISSHNTTSR